MAALKFITNARLTGIVHIHEPGFHAEIIKLAEFKYKLINIIRWPIDKHFP